MQAETNVHRLANGLRLATTEMPHMESVGVGIWTETGSRHEDETQHGMAHFIEHLLFKGTPNRSAHDISRQIESLGASLDAFTTEDHTCYHARCPAQSLDRALEVIGDLYQNPIFDPADMESEKRVIREEIAMIQDQPAQLIEDLTSSALWGERHPLGRSITGTEMTLAGFDQHSVRDFFKQAYSSSQTIISVAGKINHQEIVNKIETTFTPLPEGSPMKTQTPPPPRFGSAFSEMVNREQIHLTISFRGADRHDPTRFSQKILNVILGENMSSRLFQNLRENMGLCYEVQSDTFAFEDAGVLQIYLALDPANLGRALTGLSETIDQLRSQPPQAFEVEEAINYCVGQSRMHFENVGAQMMWAGECLMSFDRHIEPKTVLNKLQAVTPRCVQQSAQSLFQLENMAIALVGAQASINEFQGWAAEKPF